MAVSTAPAHAASTARQLSTIYLWKVLGVNCIWRNKLGVVRLHKAIQLTGWPLHCNTQGAGWLDKSSSIRYATWVMTEKVYKWSGFTLDDSHRPWRLRNNNLATDDSFLCYKRWPSSATSGSLPRQHPSSCKMVQTHHSVGSPEAHPGGHRSATVVKNIVLKARGRLLDRDDIQYLLPFLFVRYAVSSLYWSI
jgi:hypothetical protein